MQMRIISSLTFRKWCKLKMLNIFQEPLFHTKCDEEIEAGEARHRNSEENLKKKEKKSRRNFS